MNTQLATEALNVFSHLIERVDVLGYKGKKADNAALDYICGASVAASACGASQLGDYLARIVFIVSVRGMVEVRTVHATLTKIVADSDGPRCTSDRHHITCPAIDGGTCQESASCRK